MKVLIDTSIWSEALRRKNKGNSSITNSITNLIRNDQIVMIGPIRQEILSGIKDYKPFEILRNILRSFRDHPIKEINYEKAAEYYNICRKVGIQGSNTDFLICAVSIENNFQIFTLDKDFHQFSSVIPINLFTNY
jgi:predicted nucleic acid-binding protein